MSQKKGHWYRNLGTGLPRTRPAQGITGVLTNAFRSIVQDMGINPYEYNSLMEQYLQHEVSALEKKRREREARRKPGSTEPPINHAELNRRDRTTTRGNLNKEFGRDTMTWKVFCKALAFLQVRRFRLVLIVEKRNGEISNHSTPMVTLDTTSMIDEFSSLEENNLPLQPGALTKSTLTIHEDPTDEGGPKNG